jgi:hypothetical protein
MALENVTSSAVNRALDEFDALGRELFLEKYHVGPARGYYAVRNGRQYDAKAVLAAAHGMLSGRKPLSAIEFQGGEPTVARLRKLGFKTITPADRTGQTVGRVTKDPKLTSRYWALVADPQRYRVFDAVANLRVDTWTTKGRPMAVGDHAIIWQTLDRQEHRGIVALAEIIEGPRLRSDARNPYWVNPEDGTATAERVGVRYIRLSAPLWMGGPHESILASLSVSKARGGTVFHVTPEQWIAIESFTADLAHMTDVETDIELVRRRNELNSTQREALVQARLGQGRFRQDLLNHWSDACAVLDCTMALRASHIKPWRKSSDNERLDPANGLLLVATLDALFNDGWITFDDDGQMLVSDQLTQRDRSLLGAAGRLRRTPSARQREYLRFHRENEFQR